MKKFSFTWKFWFSSHTSEFFEWKLNVLFWSPSSQASFAGVASPWHNICIASLYLPKLCTDKSFLHLLNLNLIWIVITLFRLIWHHTEFRLVQHRLIWNKTEFCSVLNQSKNCNYSPNSVSFNEFPKIFVYRWRLSNWGQTCLDVEEVLEGPQLGPIWRRVGPCRISCYHPALSKYPGAGIASVSGRMSLGIFFSDICIIINIDKPNPILMREKNLLN